jgi:chromosome segregation ATPase
MPTPNSFMAYLPFLLSTAGFLFGVYSLFRRESREDLEKKERAAAVRDEEIKAMKAHNANLEIRLTGFEQMIERLADSLNARCHSLEQQFTAVPQMQADMGTMKAEMKHVVEGLGKVERRFEKFGDKMDKVYELLTQRTK